MNHPYINDGEDFGERDDPCSYFEEQCRKADRGDALALIEVDAMVEIMNNAVEEDRMSKVRELTEHINEEVRNICDSLHYCANDSLTRTVAKAQVNEIMEGLAFERHISNFIVVCDERNNTPYRVDRGELWIDIQFKMPNGSIYLAGGNTILSKATAPTPVPAPQIAIDDDFINGSIVSSGGNFNGSYSMNGVSLNTINTHSIVSSGNAQPAMNGIQSMVGQLTLDLSVSQSAELPGITFNGYDFDETKITMVLQPESTISTLEAFKIMLLINAAMHTPREFSVYAYIKANNLERHFKFTQ